jgi:hypothetical protein
MRVDAFQGRTRPEFHGPAAHHCPAACGPCFSARRALRLNATPPVAEGEDFEPSAGSVHPERVASVDTARESGR